MRKVANAYGEHYAIRGRSLEPGQWAKPAKYVKHQTARNPKRGPPGGDKWRGDKGLLTKDLSGILEKIAVMMAMPT